MKQFFLGLALALSMAVIHPAHAIVDPEDPTVLLAHDRYSHAVDRLVRRGEYSQALKLIDDALKKNPLSVQLRFQRCVVYERMGETEKARLEREAFIKRYPEIAEPYNNLAVIYSQRGNLDRAQELIERALSLRPNFALAYSNLGNLDLARARNAFDQSLSIAPNNKALRDKLKTVETLLK